MARPKPPKDSNDLNPADVLHDMTAAERTVQHPPTDTAHNATRAAVETTGPNDPNLREALGERAHGKLIEDLDMVESCVQPFEQDLFLQQKISPMFFCSALSNFGVETILQSFIDIAPQPGPLPTLSGEIQPNEPFF